MAYSIDPISANCYPGTTTLINKFDIRDEDKLNEIENAYNIFAFPPIMGYGMSFMYVAKEIQDGTLYAFDFIEAEDRVSQYLAQIKQLQKEGPYYILAYSAGAELALDVANELCNCEILIGNISSKVVWSHCAPRTK